MRLKVYIWCNILVIELICMCKKMNWDIFGLLLGLRKILLYWIDDVEFYFLFVKIYWWFVMYVIGVFVFRN